MSFTTFCVHHNKFHGFLPHVSVERRTRDVTCNHSITMFCARDLHKFPSQLPSMNNLLLQLINYKCTVQNPRCLMFYDKLQFSSLFIHFCWPNHNIGKYLCSSCTHVQSMCALLCCSVDNINIVRVFLIFICIIISRVHNIMNS